MIKVNTSYIVNVWFEGGEKICHGNVQTVVIFIRIITLIVQFVVLNIIKMK